MGVQQLRDVLESRSVFCRETAVSGSVGRWVSQLLDRVESTEFGRVRQPLMGPRRREFGRQVQPISRSGFWGHWSREDVLY